MGTPVLTNDQYCDMNGSICPYCSSRDFSIVKNNQHKPNTILECSDCREQWQEQGYMEGLRFIITGFVSILK